MGKKFELNTKAGNLRGVRVNIQENGGDWKKYRAQGWVVNSLKGDYRFLIRLRVDDALNIEIPITVEALWNMEAAIAETEARADMPKDKYIPDSLPVEPALDTFSDTEWYRYPTDYEDDEKSWWAPWE